MEPADLDLQQQRVISYLSKYGNTREDDLVVYIVQKLNFSLENSRNLVDKMLLCGRLERVKHMDLHPPVNYLKLGTLVPIEMELQAIAEPTGQTTLSPEDFERVKKILSEAKEKAKKIINKRLAESD